MPQKPNQSSVSYGDVMAAADEVERAHHCHIHFRWHMHNRKGDNWRWSLRIVALWLRTGSKVEYERGISVPWPNNDHRTPASCMLALVYQMDYKLTEEEEEAEEAQRGQHRFA